ncbi:hypothetical protein H4R24_000208 [Coemansia sp. RSA 988]|nr:hypothetical protein H4R24_000208 [Coemansia sp. RSA 988]
MAHERTVAEPHSGNETKSPSHSTLSDGNLERSSRQHCFAAGTVTAVDAAGIRVQLVTIGEVRADRLAYWSNAIAQFSRIRLSDILPHVEPVLASQGYGGMEAEGTLRFTFVSDGNEEHEHLEGLQTYRQTLGVIGIVDCAANNDMTVCYDKFLRVISHHTTAVAYRCLAFDPQEDQEDDVAGITVVPNVGGSLLFYLQTLLSDFGGTMVEALGLMAKSIEDRSDLQSPVAKTPSSGSRSLSPASIAERDELDDHSSAHEIAATFSGMLNIAKPSIVRRESAHSLPAGESRTTAERSSPGSQSIRGIVRYGGEMDREMLASQFARGESPSSPHSQPSFAAASHSTKNRKLTRNSGGASAGSGRLKKLQGDLYLMSGRLGESLDAYSAGIEASVVFNDFLWQAVGLEGYCAALLQLCERPGDRRLANAFALGAPRTAATDRTSPAAEKTGTGSMDNGLSAALTEIGGLFAQVPQLLEKCHAFAPLLHAEACMRAALVHQAAREALLLGEPALALDVLLRANVLHPQWRTDRVLWETRDVVAQQLGVPQRGVINEWLQRGWSTSFTGLALSDQLEMSSEASALFGSIGLQRKSFFFLRQFLLMAIPTLMRTSSNVRRTTSASDADDSDRSLSPRHSSASAAENRQLHSALSTFTDGSSAFAAVSAAVAAASTAPMPFGPALLRRRPAAASNTSAGTPGLLQAIVGCLDVLMYSLESGDIGSRPKSRRGWQQLQADVLRECLSAAEALPSYPHAVACAFRLVRCLSELTSIVPESQRRALFEEQHAMRSYLQRTIGLLHLHRHSAQPSPVDESGVEEVTEEAELADIDVPHVVGRDAAVLGGTLDSLVVGIQLCTPVDSALPVQSGKAPAATAPSLFLYNPSAQLQSDRPLLLVAGERSHFVATLRNPFPFALPLTDVELAAQGAAVAESASCTLPPGGLSHVLLGLIPEEDGQLRVSGLRMCLFQHLAVRCVLPDEDAHDARRRLKERPLLQRLDIERNNLIGHTDRHAELPDMHLSTMNAGHLLVATVAPHMPRLSVAECSLAHEESLSLYEGESRTVCLTLVNSSDCVGVDRMEISFEPLAVEERQSGEGSRVDAQIRDLVDAAFAYKSSESYNVPPHGSYDLHIRIGGLSGLRGGNVVVRYGCDSSAGTDWSRVLKWPVRVSVAHLLVSPSDHGAGSTTTYLDLPPYISRLLGSPSSEQSVTDSTLQDTIRILKDAVSDEPHSDLTAPAELEDSFYLVAVNLLNTGTSNLRLDIEVDLSRDAAGNGNNRSMVFSLQSRVATQKSLSRLFVPLPRVSLDETTVSAPIPGVEANGGPDAALFYPWRTSLYNTPGEDGWASGGSKSARKRQFVVSQMATEGLQSDLALHRSIYWHQQDIASRVRIRWECEQSNRSGYVDPRQLFVLDRRSLAVVRPPDVQIRVSVNGANATRTGKHLLESSCCIRKAADLSLALTNATVGDLDLLVSIRVVKDWMVQTGPEDGSHAIIKPGSGSNDIQVADSYLYAANSVERLASANIDMSFAASLPATKGTEKRSRFRFRPAIGGLGTTNRQDDNTTSSNDLIIPAQPPNASGLVLDDIEEMVLPRLAAHSTHTHSIPLYILTPGRHQVEYCVRRNNRNSSDEALPVVVKELLLINSDCENQQ